MPSGSYVSSDKALVTVLGADNLIVVASEDAVLVANRDRTADLRQLVAQLKSVAPNVTQEHLKVHRPWGSYQSLDQGDRYQVKRIIVKPKGRLSLQKHHHRAEHWVVVRGTAQVTIGDVVKIVHENEFDLYPDRHGAPAREPRQDRPGADRGAERQLPRRGRHRPPRRRLSPVVTGLLRRRNCGGPRRRRPYRGIFARSLAALTDAAGDAELRGTLRKIADAVLRSFGKGASS